MANRRFIDFPIAATVGNNDIVLIWQDGLNKQTTKATLLQGSPQSLAGLTDVDIAALTNGQILQYNSTTSKWENVDRTDIFLSQLGDVTIVAPSNGQVLVYNSSTSKWENSSGGYVPYTGAVTTVNLGSQTIQAGSFVKTGGTAAQFLKANGSVDSTAYGTGSVTSVALTMPTAFTVAGSPITTAGTLAVTATGTTAQYIRGDGSLATFPGLTGFVPYTGATADVNLGTHDLAAERGTFTNNGSSDALTVNQTSGSGYGIIVTKGGNNEALYVSKTSGSGNAMTVVGGRTSLVDLALSSVTNTAGDFLTLSGGVVHKRTAAEVRTDIGAGTVTSVGLSSATSGVTIGSTPITISGTITLAIATASGSQNGLLSSTDWTTFNGKQNALTNPVTGTGTSGQVAYFTGTSAISSESNLFWDATNDRLGIGTNFPTANLEVYNASQGNIYISSALGNASALRFFSGGNEYVTLRNLANGNFDIETGTGSPATRLRIFSNGNVFIGSSPTDAGYKLDVNGTGRFKVSTDRNLAFKYDTNITLSAQADGGGPESLRIYADTFRIYTATSTVGLTERFTITNTGRVQIDDSGSSSKLAVRGGNSTYPASSSASYTLSLNDPTSAAINVGGSLIFQGFKTSNTAVGNFAGIVGKKENGTGGNESGFLGFLTGDSGGTFSEQMRITSDGYVRLSASSGGIQFNGDTAAANALDDYEEGTHSPSATPAGGGSFTTVTQSGNYVKIGKLVHYSFIVNVNSVGTATGDVIITLPFVVNLTPIRPMGSGRENALYGNTLQIRTVSDGSATALIIGGGVLLNSWQALGSITYRTTA